MGTRETKTLTICALGLALVAIFRSYLNKDEVQADRPVGHLKGWHFTGKPIWSPRKLTARLNIPAGATVIVASLDRFAGRHNVQLCFHPTNQMMSSTELSPTEVPEDWDVEYLSGDSTFGRTEVSTQSGTDIVLKSVRTEIPDSSIRTRRFSVPRFSGNDGLFDRVVVGTLVASGPNTTVFAEDHGDPEACRVAQQILNLVEGGLAVQVDQRIGPIADVDHDGSLTFVLSTLTDESYVSGTEQPISGCVRPRDYLQHDGDFSGDVIYLDIGLPTDERLAAILTHEMAHAATYSRLRTTTQCNAQRRNMPCWLSESIAHYVEQSICPESENLRTRRAAFLQQSNSFSVIIPDGISQRSQQRGPSRAAGYLFLQSVLTELPKSALCQIIDSDKSGVAAIEDVCGQSFESLFRVWSIRMLPDLRQQPLTDNSIDELDLAGTAVSCMQPVNTDGVLSITAFPEARLQVTILTGGR